MISHRSVVVAAGQPWTEGADAVDFMTHAGDNHIRRSTPTLRYMRIDALRTHMMRRGCCVRPRQPKELQGLVEVKKVNAPTQYWQPGQELPQHQVQLHSAEDGARLSYPFGINSLVLPTKFLSQQRAGMSADLNMYKTHTLVPRALELWQGYRRNLFRVRCTTLNNGAAVRQL